MAEDPMFVTMFTDEARIAGDLHHPNIVEVYDVGEAEGIYYITMEFLEGRDLAQVMGRAVKLGRSLGLGNAMQIVRDIAAGAHYAHVFEDQDGVPLNIVHRDLSPRNIMITFDGRCKILDFGLAKARNQVNVTLPGKIKGTPSYLAPEQLDGKPVTPSADIFALGTLLFELTTLRRLFRRGTTIDTMRAVKACHVPRPSTLVRRYPPAIEQIVLKALARDPAERYHTAKALLDSIDRVMDQLGVARRPAVLGRTVAGLFEDPSRELPLQLANPEASASSTQADPPAARFPIEASSVLEHRSNLPLHKTRFIGRNSLLKALGAAIDGTSRLVTLYGPPGTGKTRVAIEFARSRIQDYRRAGGVWIIEGEDIGTPIELCGAIGSALAVPLQGPESTNDVTDVVGRALSGRGEMLLVLDNVDRVARELGPLLTKWLEMTEELRFLVTTRELLRISEEHPVEVPPLALPTSAADTDNSPSVLLFIDRAHAVKPEWKPTRRDKDVIRRLVNRLDGIPLAIELAASRIVDTTPSTLLDQLGKRLDVLSAPGGKGRQATLDQAIEWSWAQLEPWERAALAQASVFHGGFDMEAADAVLDLSQWPDAPWVVDVLQALRNKSMVRSYEAAEFPGEPRCRQYVSVRVFARRKLEEMGGTDGAMDRHAEHYLRIGSYWSSGAGQRTGVEGRRRLSIELSNLLSVLRRQLSKRPVTEESATKAMEAALALAPVVNVRGPFSGFLKLLNATLDLTTAGIEVPAQLEAEVRLVRGHIHRVHGSVEPAKADFREVMALARENGDRSLAGRGLTEMGTLRLILGQHIPAQDMLRRALTMHKDVGDVAWQGRTLLAAGNVCLMRGDTDRARACFEGALPRFRAVGEVVLEGACLGNLGTLEQASGRLQEAMNNLERAVALHREVGANRFEGYALVCLGSVSHELSDMDRASEFYSEGLQRLREVGDRRWEGVALGYLGVLLHETGRFESARKRLERALELLTATGDTRMATIANGALGAVMCAMGEPGKAEKLLERAEELARKSDDEMLTDVIDVYRAYIDIAESLDAPSRAGAELLRDAARDRLVRAMVKAEPGDLMTSDLADLYRLSVRLLKQTVEAVDAAAAG